MEKENLLNQLDYVLKYLEKTRSIFELVSKLSPEDITTKGVSFDDIYKLIYQQQGYKTSKGNLYKILDKLISDGFVTTKLEQYFITWEGRYFMEVGGYEGREKNRVLADTISYRNNNLLRGYALAAAIGGCGVFLMEVLKFVLANLPCCSCHH